MVKEEKLPEKGKSGKEKLILLFALGCLFVLLSIPPGSGKKTPEETKEQTGMKLEERIRAILENTEGVGNVDVMVMMEETSDGFSGRREESGRITGMIISAEGADSAVVRSEISSAMEALSGLPSHKIKVLKRVRKGDR